MNNLLYLLALIGFALPWLIGMVVLVQMFRKPPEPCDQSNLFNRWRLLWFALTRQDKFVTVCPWLMHDEWDNVNDR